MQEHRVADVADQTWRGLRKHLETILTLKHINCITEMAVKIVNSEIRYNKTISDNVNLRMTII